MLRLSIFGIRSCNSMRSLEFNYFSCLRMHGCAPLQNTCPPQGCPCHEMVSELNVQKRLPVRKSMVGVLREGLEHLYPAGVSNLTNKKSPHGDFRWGRERSNLQTLSPPNGGTDVTKKTQRWSLEVAAKGSNVQTISPPQWGHGCDKKDSKIWSLEVGARGLEPPNLTDVNRAL
jgi:hypothetical protein